MKTNYQVAKACKCNWKSNTSKMCHIKC